MFKNSFTQFERSLQPKPGELPELKLPTIQRAELSNGLKIMLVEHHKLPVVNVQLVLQAGAEADAGGKAGVARFTASMIDEGTPTKNSLEIADAFDFLGAQFSSAASFDGSFISLTTLKERLDEAFQTYSEVLLRPTFPQHEFDRLKKELLTSLTQQKDRANVVASIVFNKMLYGTQHPYAYQAAGDETTVNAITLSDVQNFYNTFYAPNAATMIFVGDISLPETIAVAEKYFGSWERKKLPVVTLTKTQNEDMPVMYLVDKPGAPQSEIRLGHLGTPRSTEDYFKLTVLQHILGSSSGRLFLNLREAKGYTYGAYASFTFRKSVGPFIATAGVRTDVTEASITEFLYEINRIRNEIVPDTEFEMYKTAVIQRLLRMFETPNQISDQLASIALYNLPDDYLNNITTNLKNVMQADIQYAANKYLLPGQLSIIVVGDVHTIKPSLEKLGIAKTIHIDVNGTLIQ